MAKVPCHTSPSCASPGQPYVPIPIPSNQAFLQQWHQWTYEKAARHFRRNKERAFETAQNVRLRLLAKDFIGRWLFKHLTDELVDLQEAKRILGGALIEYIGALQPVHGKRVSPDSLWRISDLLRYARFDYPRFYYSIQSHTISTDSVLRLLGCGPTDYGILESLYRQGRLRPAELTEHVCVGPSCIACERGRASLRSRGLSLADRWMNPKVATAVAKLRWNDSQLRPFLRQWRRTNLVFATPHYIMRPTRGQGIDAGLLEYAELIIDHEVVNDFKRMTRTDDMSSMVFNKGVCPEHSDADVSAWESSEFGEDEPVRVFRDTESMDGFSAFELKSDLRSLILEADLSPQESDVVLSVDLMETPVRLYAESQNIPVQKVHRLRNSALAKLREAALT